MISIVINFMESYLKLFYFCYIWILIGISMLWLRFLLKHQVYGIYLANTRAAFYTLAAMSISISDFILLITEIKEPLDFSKIGVFSVVWLVVKNFFLIYYWARNLAFFMKFAEWEYTKAQEINHAS